MFDRPLLMGALALSLIVLLGTGGYMTIEGWGLLDSVWMVAITLTTIGFGEVHPLSPWGRGFTLILIVAGVSVGTYTMSQLTAQIVEGRMGAALRLRQRRRKVGALNDHFIVVGYGRLGSAVVEELLASGARVCVIEKNPPALAELTAAGIAYVQGDGSDDQALKEAGIARARGLAVAVSSSAEAVFVTLSARQLNPTINIVTRAADVGNAAKARRAGATSIVSPHTMGGWRMAHGLVRPHASSFLDLANLATHADIQLDEFVVPAGSTFVGTTMRAQRINERFGVLVVAIRRVDGRLVATPPATIAFDAEDVVIVIGSPKGVADFGASLGK